MANRIASDINTLCFCKGDEKYVWLYTDEFTEEALRSLGRFAANPELSFSWWDAAMLAQKIRTGV